MSAKGPMTGSGNAFADKHKQDMETVSDDSVSDLGGCGTWNRHQVFSLLIVCGDTNRRWLIPYSSIVPCDTGTPGDGEFSFQFAVGEKLMEVVVTGHAGEKLDRVLFRIAAGKRETLKAGGDPVTSVVVREV